MKRILAAILAVLSSCSEPPPDATAQIYDAMPPAGRAAELLASLSAADGKGVHGSYHQIKADAERELWKLVSALPASVGGDHVLAAAIERVYTRYDANYYHGTIWHWPYLDSKRAVTLADKLLKDFPRSALAEHALWLKAFALRCAPVEPHDDYAAAFDTYREQMLWKPDPEAARQVYRDLAARFPRGRYATASRTLADAVVLLVELPSEPAEPDPRFVQ